MSQEQLPYFICIHMTFVNAASVINSLKAYSKNSK